MINKSILFFAIAISVPSVLAGQYISDYRLPLQVPADQNRPELIQATEGKPYEDAMQVLVPHETSFLVQGKTIQAKIVRQVLLEVSGLPPGMTFTCSSPDCVFLPGASAYLTLQGTPEVPGFFALKAYFSTEAEAGVETFTRNSQIDYYSIVVQPDPQGRIYESIGQGFEMEQNTPNPCSENTGIRFSVPAAGEVDLRIFNLIGKEVYRSLINVESGRNELKLDVRDFSPGIYMYTMIFEGQSISKRMVISRK